MSVEDEQARDVANWQVLAFRARSFRWASAFLSREQRRSVAALYAFCRAVDDLADSDWVTPEDRAELETLLAALAAEPEGEALWPESYMWFRELCLECGIDFGVVRELIIGMMSDLDVVRLQSDRELVRYCYRAAGTVGLMMCSILGVRDPRALRHAIDLGIAMQLTNISRDVLEDAEACRVYLPADRLEELGVAPDDLVDGRADPQAVSIVVSDVLELAERYYESGDAGMRYLPARARWAVLVASRLYRGIGRRLRRRHGGNPMLGRVIVPWFQKVGLVLTATTSWFRVTLRPARAFATLRYHDYLFGLPGTTTSAKTRLGEGHGRAQVLVSETGTTSPQSASDTGGLPVAAVSRSGHALGHPH